MPDLIPDWVLIVARGLVMLLLALWLATLEPVPFAHSTIIYRAHKPIAEQFWQHALAGFWQKVRL